MPVHFNSVQHFVVTAQRRTNPLVVEPTEIYDLIRQIIIKILTPASGHHILGSFEEINAIYFAYETKERLAYCFNVNKKLQGSRASDFQVFDYEVQIKNIPATIKTLQNYKSTYLNGYSIDLARCEPSTFPEPVPKLQFELGPPLVVNNQKCLTNAPFNPSNFSNYGNLSKKQKHSHEDYSTIFSESSTLPTTNIYGQINDDFDDFDFDYLDNHSKTQMFTKQQQQQQLALLSQFSQFPYQPMSYGLVNSPCMSMKRNDLHEQKILNLETKLLMMQQKMSKLYQKFGNEVNNDGKLARQNEELKAQLLEAQRFVFSKDKIQQEEINELRQRLTEKDGTIEILKSNLNENQEKAGERDRQINEAMEGLAKKLREKQSLIDQLSEQLMEKEDELKNKISQLTLEISEKQQKIEELDKERLNNQETLKALSNQINGKEKIIEELKESLTQIEQTSVSEKSIREKEMKDLRQEIFAKEDKIEALTNQMIRIVTPDLENTSYFASPSNSFREPTLLVRQVSPSHQDLLMPSILSSPSHTDEVAMNGNETTDAILYDSFPIITEEKGDYTRGEAEDEDDDGDEDEEDACSYQGTYRESCLDSDQMDTYIRRRYSHLSDLCIFSTGFLYELERLFRNEINLTELSSSLVLTTPVTSLDALLSKRFLIFPLLNNGQWSLLVFDLRTGVLVYFDTIGSEIDETIQKWILNFVQRITNIDSTLFNLSIKYPTISKQSYQGDSGIYTLHMLDLLLASKDDDYECLYKDDLTNWYSTFHVDNEVETQILDVLHTN